MLGLEHSLEIFQGRVLCKFKSLFITVFYSNINLVFSSYPSFGSNIRCKIMSPQASELHYIYCNMDGWKMFEIDHL